MWGTFLSEPLSIVGLVGRYPANCLMERMPIYQRWIFSKYPHAGPLLHAVLVRLSPGYPPLIGKLHTRYSPVRRSPPGIATCAAPRLACVKPVASVHPEPGSNSSLLYLVFSFFFFKKARLGISFAWSWPYRPHECVSAPPDEPFLLCWCRNWQSQNLLLALVLLRYTLL